MALSGARPRNTKLGRTPSADWTDVPDLPYDGLSPDLPKLSRRRRWRDEVVEWWEEVRRMPHCRLWTPTDWRFALEIAHMKQQFWTDLDEGEMKTTTATEIRRREDQIGTTSEARRKLRVRYVHPDMVVGDDDLDDGEDVDQPAAGELPAAVASLTERRKRLTQSA